MTTSTPALVNHIVLAWARQESGYPPEPVAKRLNVKPEHVLAWEQGEKKPTVRQAQELAKFYHRPFGVFFLPQPPVIPPLAAEYRHLPGVKPGVESPEFRLALRVMSLRREIALELSKELGVPATEFSIVAHLSETPAAVGARLRGALGITTDEQLGWSSTSSFAISRANFHEGALDRPTTLMMRCGWITIASRRSVKVPLV